MAVLVCVHQEVFGLKADSERAHCHGSKSAFKLRAPSFLCADPFIRVLPIPSRAPGSHLRDVIHYAIWEHGIPTLTLITWGMISDGKAQTVVSPLLPRRPCLSFFCTIRHLPGPQNGDDKDKKSKRSRKSVLWISSARVQLPQGSVTFDFF